MSISAKLAANKAAKIEEIISQIEELRTMPEGHRLSRGDDREMTERRRARYLAEGGRALAAIRELPEGHFSEGFMRKDVLFDYA